MLVLYPGQLGQELSQDMLPLEQDQDLLNQANPLHLMLDVSNVKGMHGFLPCFEGGAEL